MPFALRAKKPMDRDLCVYIAEAGDEGVQQKVIHILTQCVQDKIFSGNEDVLCLARDDHMNELEFSGLSWEILRKLDLTFREPRAEDRKPDPMATLSAVSESILIQAEEDVYENKKILFFANFLAPLKDRELEALSDRITQANIFLTIVVPDQTELSKTQEANVELLKRVFDHNNSVYVSYLKEAARHLANTLSKKPVRPTPWNVKMEIGPKLSIDVQSFVLVRKNTSTELKTALEKSILSLVKPKQTLVGSAAGGTEEDGDRSVVGREEGGGGPSQTDLEPQDFVLTKDEVRRETTWRETEDGTAVDPEDIIEAYLYGERLIPLDEVDKSQGYKSGEKCFKVLVFCPRQNIKPSYLLGNGMDLVLPQKGNPVAQLKFDALLRALESTGRVAIVRKVRSTNSKLILGLLAPCMERKGLVMTELCFGDDISTPYFRSLFPEDAEELEDGMSEKESLMDELIMGMSLDQFTPAQGPVDPAIQVLRDNITRKILGKPLSYLDGSGTLAQAPLPPRDNIDLFFEKTVVREDVGTQLQHLFPLTDVEKKTEKKEAVRKRGHSPPSPSSLPALKNEACSGGGGGQEKKIKTEQTSGVSGREDFDADFLVCTT